jgi:type I restriction enzyme S subunit
MSLLPQFMSGTISHRIVASCESAQVFIRVSASAYDQRKNPRTEPYTCRMSSVLTAQRSHVGFGGSQEATADADTAKTIADLIKTDGIFVDGDWVETKDQDPQGNVRLIQLADVGDGNYRNRSARFLTSAKARELGCTFLKPGDLLIARMPDPLGRACIFPGDEKSSVTVVDVCIVRTGKGGTDHRWLMHRINSADMRAAIGGLQSGSTRKRISRSNLARIKFSVPSLGEQQRIVAEIEKQFTRLEAGVSLLKRLQAALKRYRASVLKAACEGRLVRTEAELARIENRSYETGEELLQRILKERREKWKGKGNYKEPIQPVITGMPKLPLGWCWAGTQQLTEGIDNAMTIGPFGSNLMVKDYRETGVPLIFVREIRSENFRRSDTRYISQEKAAELATHKVRGGDLVITKMGEPPGDTAIYPESLPDAIATSDCIKLTPNRAGTTAAFLKHAIRAQPVTDQIERITRGVAQKKVSLARFKTVAVPFPPLAEQTRIVAEVERRLTVVEELDAVVSANLTRAIRLRQGILKDAFTEALI